MKGKISKEDKPDVAVIVAAAALHAIVAGPKPDGLQETSEEAVERAFELADKFVAEAERRGVFED